MLIDCRSTTLRPGRPVRPTRPPRTSSPRRDFEFVRAQRADHRELLVARAQREPRRNGPIQQWHIDKHLGEDVGAKLGATEFALRVLEGRRPAADETDAPMPMSLRTSAWARTRMWRSALRGRVLDVGAPDDDVMSRATTPTGEPHAPSPPPLPMPAEEPAAAAAAPVPAPTPAALDTLPVSRSPEAIACHIAALEALVAHDWEEPPHPATASQPDWAAFMGRRRTLVAKAVFNIAAASSRARRTSGCAPCCMCASGAGEILPPKQRRRRRRRHKQWAQRVWDKGGMRERRAFDDNVRAFKKREARCEARRARGASRSWSCTSRSCTTSASFPTSRDPPIPAAPEVSGNLAPHPDGVTLVNVHRQRRIARSPNMGRRCVRLDAQGFVRAAT
ncbi:hypothetical protein AURDEDRAFT_172475 [Auricularia subglabra TFB-10046 SS5]|nr:hypothetical protein AURDEDRAFT_172475 [Auricularia subglabra TFB-10046 SS5]